MTQRAYKYRMYPNDNQRALLARTFGCVRKIWNHNVEVFRSYNSEISSRTVPRTSTEIRNDPELAYMLEVSAAALQQKENDFKEFKKQFFKKSRKRKIGLPQFHGKNDRQSYRLPAQKFAVLPDRIRLEKIGFVEAVIHQQILTDSRLVSVTVSRDTCGDYYASVLVDESIVPRFAPTGRTVGVDVGLASFATLSTGEQIENPRWLRKNQARLRTAQKHLSRKRKGSVRREKCRKIVAKLYRKVSRQRSWFHHNLSLRLVREFDVISTETLNIHGMLRNRHLAKSISDAGWHSFMRMLEYKAQWNQRELVRVSMWFPSTVECSCGVRNKHLKLSHRVWTCAACGKTHVRDVHSAEKLDVEGLRLLAEARVKRTAKADEAAATMTENAPGVDGAKRTPRRCKPESARNPRVSLKRTEGGKE